MYIISKHTVSEDHCTRSPCLNIIAVVWRPSKTNIEISGKQDDFDWVNAGCWSPPPPLNICIWLYMYYRYLMQLSPWCFFAVQPTVTGPFKKKNVPFKKSRSLNNFMRKSPARLEPRWWTNIAHLAATLKNQRLESMNFRVGFAYSQGRTVSFKWRISPLKVAGKMIYFFFPV